MRGVEPVKTLLVLRHAKSSWKDSGLADHDRPLNKRGKRDSRRMGKLVRAENLMPELIVSSTARRAKETAQAVADKASYEGRILFDERLYLADPQGIVELIRGLEHPSAGRVMIVGHNPGLEDLIRGLAGAEGAFPTAALAHIELPIEAWRDLELSTKGRLVHLWRPKELDD